MSSVLDQFKLFIFDLDGVVYEGKKVIKGATDVLATLNKKNKIIYALTNNSTLTREMYHDKLLKIGIKLDVENIMTSAYASAYYLSQNFGSNKNAYVIGEVGLLEELEKVDIFPVNKYSQNELPETVDFVVVGLDRELHYNKLAFALNYILKGAMFIASNDDPNLPSDNGILPGAGSMVSALTTCSGKKPYITIGKPNPITINQILNKEQVSPGNTVIIGDRFTTDISAGLNAGIKTIMVLTGAGKSELNLALNAPQKPHMIVDSINDLLKII
ncbi:MAG: HAD-IIA family hydrolase [Candidatus Helarchaeota archaeon]